MNDVKVVDCDGVKVGLAYIQDETDAILIMGYDQSFLATEILAHRNTFNWYEPDECLRKIRDSELPEKYEKSGVTILGFAALTIYKGLQSEKKLTTARGMLKTSKPLLEENPMFALYFLHNSIVVAELGRGCRVEVCYSQIQATAVITEITDKFPFEVGQQLYENATDYVEQLPVESKLIPDGSQGLIAECVVVAMMGESGLPMQQQADVYQEYPWRHNYQNN